MIPMDSSAYTGGGLLQDKQLSESQLARKAELIEAGNTAFDDDELTTALDCYHRASIIDSSDAETWCLVGLAYANLDLNEEAWRSYKLALICDPDHLNALWYAGEFLFNNEDFVMARLLIERYANLEEDREKVEEAQEMLAECRRQTADEDLAPPVPAFAGSDDPDDDVDGDESEMDGFEVHGQFDDEDDDFDEDEDYSADNYDDDGEDRFIASLNLDLTSMRAKCTKCGVGLPIDAPYCYNCLAPHLYEVQ